MAGVSVTGLSAVAVSWPPPAGQSTMFIFNEGPSPAYLGSGSGVSAATGLELPASARVDLAGYGGTAYAIAGGNPSAPYGTATAATVIGGTVITVASGGTAFTAGMTVVVDPSTALQEVATVSASSGTSVTVSAAFTFVHGSAATFSQYSAYETSLSVIRGAV